MVLNISVYTLAKYKYKYKMTKAQEFMTAVEDNNLFNHYSVIALRKEVNKLENKVEYLDILLDRCITEKTL